MWYVDKHVVKMILETAQLLCSAMVINNIPSPYKLTHKNHPSAVWTRQSKENWNWLKILGLEMCKEYTYRYGKIHKCQSIIETLECPNMLSNDKFTEPPKCMPDWCKENDTIQSYKNYIFYEKKHIHTWTKREKPEWFSDFLN